MSTEAKVGLKHQALLAVLEVSAGNLERTFTAEELVVHAWKKDMRAWGLRGYELEHPDPEKMNKEVERRSTSLIRQGLLERVRPLIYRLTAAGLAAASQLTPTDTVTKDKAGRALEDVIRPILEHEVFKGWLCDSSHPKYFREAGHFWGIAPGTPAKVVQERLARVETTLNEALRQLDVLHTNEMRSSRGQALFDRKDIERCLEFQNTLRQRFARELRILSGIDGSKSQSA